MVVTMSKNHVNGYAGQLLSVDMTNATLSDLRLDEATLRVYVGGTGIGAKILYDEVAPSSPWSHPDNRFIVASGPLGGTSIGGSGTVSVVTKGALTNGATATQANGYFGAFLKFSGYDGVVVHGSSTRWRYLHIDDGTAELRDASHLLRRDTYETADRIKDELGKQDLQMSVLSIGPAGEHLVRFAGVFVDKGHSASHNGAGAVMGSKRLKAIAVARGPRRVDVSDRGRLREVADAFYEEVKDFTGTIGGVHRSQVSNSGTLPIKNYTTNVWDIADDEVYGFSEEDIRRKFAPTPHPCWACRLTHSTMMTVPQGPYKGMVVEEPEYEQMAAWGPVIDAKDAAAAFMLSSATDRLGVDNNEAGWLMGWLMEGYERGWITRDAVDGLDLTWGNVEAVRQVLHMIANRVGCGDVLAEGVMRASQKMGGDAAKAAIYTLKGNTPRGHDHRTRWKEMFDTCTSNTGTLETATYPTTPELTGPGYPMDVSTYEATAKGLMVFEDSVGTCRFNTRTNVPLLADAVNAVTGWDMTPEEARNVGLRAINLMRAFNIQAGITRELDRPSERYGSTPVDGPSKGISIQPHWDAMLDNYYRLLGWDLATGKPLKATLKALGLEHVIADIW
jgi:aldehyde:ferredoxin oxidoreductase